MFGEISPEAADALVATSQPAEEMERGESVWAVSDDAAVRWLALRVLGLGCVRAGVERHTPRAVAALPGRREPARRGRSRTRLSTRSEADRAGDNVILTAVALRQR